MGQLKNLSVKTLKLTLALAIATSTPFVSANTTRESANGFNIEPTQTITAEGAIRLNFSIPQESTTDNKGRNIDVIAIPLGDMSDYKNIDDAHKTKRQVLTQVIPALEAQLNDQLPTTEKAIKIGPTASKAIDWWMNNPVAQWLRSPAFKNTDFSDPNREKNVDVLATDMRNFHLVLALVRGGGHIFIQYMIIGATLSTALTVGTMSAFFGVTYELLGKFLLYKGFVPKSWIAALGSMGERLNVLSKKAKLTATETLEKERLRKLQNESMIIQEQINPEGSKKELFKGSVLSWMYREFAFHSPATDKKEDPAKKGPAILDSLLGGLYKYWLIEIVLFLLPAMAAEQGLDMFINDPLNAITILVVAGVMSVWMQYFADIWNYNWTLKVKDKIERTAVPTGVDKQLYKEALVDGHRFMSVMRGLFISLIAVSYAVFLANSSSHGASGGLMENLDTVAVLGIGGLLSGAAALHVKYGSLINAFKNSLEQFKKLFGNKKVNQVNPSLFTNYIDETIRNEVNILFDGTSLGNYKDTQNYNEFMIPASALLKLKSACESPFSIF